ncbi:type II toxin-antitoxin system HipA family toxin [Castellaniella sp. S9]|uniref:type II toxin-antitoxin system HipA family toxin n=1 Tax=Castellaniella sp. S9 TaxID=2993652 RepID=UPI0022B33FB6|nr:HipA domain-containing protein [Castellaniella sp. S9]
MDTAIHYLRLYFHCPDGRRRAIGHLSRYGDILRVSFDPDYVEDPGRPTVSLSYRGTDEAATRAILTAIRDARLTRADGKWPAFFQNLLPEGHNRERLARARGCAPEDEFELLAAAGHDLMGALEVEPVPPDEGIPDAVRVWHTVMGLDVLEPGFVESPVEDAASIPGVVTKFSAVREGRRYVVRRRGAAGAYILKLPSIRHPDLVANEYAAYQLAGALGLDCAHAELIGRRDADLPEDLPFEDVLVVRRFDRGPDGRRIHMEEFNQILGYEPRHKYGKGIFEDYPAMLRIIDRFSADPARDAQEFVGRFVAFVLMGNTDAHLKNWAVRYPDAAEPVLAPLYDPVCVTALFDRVGPTDYAVNRAIDARLRTFDWADLARLLELARVPRAARLLQVAKATVRAAQDRWPAILETAPESMRAAILERLDRGVALTRGLG